MNVIDISDWQEGLNFDDLRNNGVDGVVIKIEEGQSEDADFETFLQDVENEELEWGVYLFSHATSTDIAIQEAQNLIANLNGRVPPLGTWYDIEADECFNSGVNPTDLCSSFICTVNDAGLKCGIYASDGKFGEGENEINPNTLGDYVPYWVAEYGVSQCDFPSQYPNKHMAAWQDSENGNIDGTNVDTDQWYDDPL
ncbi:GH25 family lysozyme [Megasphaera sueciensis]|uniref:GH25 family lysozyme n=1 Tax=Megasphaera sueciensis TaxID=349094 RepID=UPI003CFCC8DE